jgi:iron complex transport system ATP-binding protein
MPIGPGNVTLLREAVTAAQHGLGVILLNPAGNDSSEPSTFDGKQRKVLATRDYTGGEGLKLLEDLLQAGAMVVDSVGDALEKIKLLP